MAFQIICDGSIDLGKDIPRESGIHVVPFYVSFDGEIYEKEGEELEVHKFYQRMKDEPQVYPRTSLPSVQDYVDAFEGYLQEGMDILCICLSSELSGSYNSARAAADLMGEKYPNQQIRVVDSTLVTVLEGVLALEAVRMRDAGISLDQAVEQLERLKKTGRIFFTIGTMDYLVHGGRVGKLIGLAASTLRLRPLIVWKDDEITSFGVSRSRAGSIAKVIEAAKGYLQKLGGPLSHYQIFVGYGYDREEGISLRDRFAGMLKELGEAAEIQLYQVGTTIGVHTGPYPLGIGILEKFEG
ncbi:DegV family protein [Hominifimenecus sp. rT4P-3]|uniref:DegV family protein n=1 Tax=Hominifimenecus sp. rT4P-3 TaxID=3242979 RepID=UPI003DA65CD0